MKNVSAIVWVLGLPLVMAALLATSTYAWNSFTVNPEPVEAGGGADTREGVVVTSIKSDGGQEYIVIYDHAKYMGDGVMRPFLTTYELKRKGDGNAELYLVGSRCIEWDRGFPMVGYSPKKIETPEKMKRAQRINDEETDDPDDGSDD